MSMPLLTTLFLAKLTATMSRVFRVGGGQALPGVVAERLRPSIASSLAEKLPHGVILVTGTNGKTTTTKQIAAILEASGERVLTNGTGSNLRRGIVSALVGAANLGGHLQETIGLFEVDEASLRRVASDLNPHGIVVLNLFRDQLDRYGELDTTAALIGEGIAATNADLYLNADDPLVASLAKYARNESMVHYFGIDEMPTQSLTAHMTAVDSDRCPICHERLQFSHVFYGHIGHYRCEICNFARPETSISIAKIEDVSVEGTRFVLSRQEKNFSIFLPLPGTYNLYNALAAVALSCALGIPMRLIRDTVAKTQPAFGRVEKIILRDRTIYLLLIKNPAGFTQVLETFLLGQDRPTICFAINDLAADGRDVSWLWDVPLEVLASRNPNIITTGMRGADMALRLYYAGMDAEVVGDFGAAMNKFIITVPEGGVGYILPSYTAMLTIRKWLAERADMQEVWK